MDFTKTTYKNIKTAIKKLFNKTDKEIRPWGFYRVIEEKRDYKLKEICVLSGHRLSYQKHLIRSEYWCVISGNAIVILDGKEISLAEGDTIHIPRSSWHRIENREDSDLIIIELQRGSYLGEDDIERKSDDYGRA